MTAVTVESHGKVALLRLTNGVTNAIGPALLSVTELQFSMSSDSVIPPGPE